MPDSPCLFQRLIRIATDSQCLRGNILIFPGRAFQPYVPRIQLLINLLLYSLAALIPGHSGKVDTVYVHIIQKHGGIRLYLGLYLPEINTTRRTRQQKQDDQKLDELSAKSMPFRRFPLSYRSVPVGRVSIGAPRLTRTSGRLRPAA